MTHTTSEWGNRKEQEGWVLAPFIDMAEHDTDEVGRFILHVGITAEAMKAASGDVAQAILTHYRCCSHGYDVERVASDLATFPPIARRVAELRYEREIKRGKRSRSRKPA
jgi:hypothetical protein